MVRIFDIQNGQVIPTEHCYTLKSLREIMDNFPNYLSIYAYIFYMTCPNPDLNPFFDVPENDKEELILREINADFSPEDPYIINGMELCQTMYQTATYRAYMGIKIMLDNLADYMAVTKITDGRDGNITALVNAGSKLDGLRQSYKGIFKDLQEEQQSTVRGGQSLGYDQG